MENELELDLRDLQRAEILAMRSASIRACSSSVHACCLYGASSCFKACAISSLSLIAQPSSWNRALLLVSILFILMRDLPGLSQGFQGC